MIETKLSNYLIHENEGHFALLWLTNKWPLVTNPAFRAEPAGGGYCDLVIESGEGTITLQAASREVIQGILTSPFFVIYQSEGGVSTAVEIERSRTD